MIASGGFSRLRRVPLAGRTLAAILALALVAGSMPASAAIGDGAQRAGAGLSAEDTDRYRTIFAAQEKGAWKKADRLIAQLDDPVLLGYALAQRYLHPTHYRSRYRELAAWLERYADHPDAAVIYKLARTRKPAGVRGPRRPVVAKDSLAAELPLGTVFPYRSDKRLSRSQVRRIQSLKRRFRRDIRRTYLTRAERLLQRADLRRLFDRYELDDAYSQVAAGWLYYGKPEKALQFATTVARRSGVEIPTVHWTAGLAYWTLDRKGEAVQHFETLATSEAASGWNRAAGAYWAARVHLEGANTAEAYRWFTVAAGYPFTFYGQLAHRRLGLRPEIGFDPVAPRKSDVDPLLAGAQGKRAAALFQLARPDLAERELMAVAGWRKPETTRAILAIAEAGGLQRLGLEIARRLLDDDVPGWTRDDLAGVMYPLPQWSPTNGFAVDRALIYAFIRQESAFDPMARSPAGARGLMQLMPRTASWLDRRNSYRGSRRALLYDPSLNLALAQRYVKWLLESPRVDGDLLRMSVAYNAGPGNLGKWERRMKHADDPLLFLESLPSLESRLFVERVMTNLWIYRLRLGQPTPTLDALAADRWPAYVSLDRPAEQIASEE